MIGKSPRVRWITEHTACAVCTHPLAPDVERVVIVDVAPLGQVCVCWPCFQAAPCPRLEMIAILVRVECQRSAS